LDSLTTESSTLGCGLGANGFCRSGTAAEITSWLEVMAGASGGSVGVVVCSDLTGCGFGLVSSFCSFGCVGGEANILRGMGLGLGGCIDVGESEFELASGSWVGGWKEETLCAAFCAMVTASESVLVGGNDDFLNPTFCCWEVLLASCAGSDGAKEIFLGGALVASCACSDGGKEIFLTAGTVLESFSWGGGKEIFLTAAGFGAGGALAS
jgi:hypothetical protein